MGNIFGMVAQILIALVALEHLYILWMEMFAWETAGKKTFKGALPEELFKATKGLAANQGLYNGFLAAGLIWSFFISNEAWQQHYCPVLSWLCGHCRNLRRVVLLQENIFCTGPASPYRDGLCVTFLKHRLPHFRIFVK